MWTARDLEENSYVGLNFKECAIIQYSDKLHFYPKLGFSSLFLFQHVFIVDLTEHKIIGLSGFLRQLKSHQEIQNIYRDFLSEKR